MKIYFVETNGWNGVAFTDDENSNTRNEWAIFADCVDGIYINTGSIPELLRTWETADFDPVCDMNSDTNGEMFADEILTDPDFENAFLIFDSELTAAENLKNAMDSIKIHRMNQREIVNFIAYAEEIGAKSISKNLVHQHVDEYGIDDLVQMAIGNKLHELYVEIVNMKSKNDWYKTDEELEHRFDL